MKNLILRFFQVDNDESVLDKIKTMSSMCDEKILTKSK